jgi:hypothetical protein
MMIQAKSAVFLHVLKIYVKPMMTTYSLTYRRMSLHMLKFSFFLFIHGELKKLWSRPIQKNIEMKL